MKRKIRTIAFLLAVCLLGTNMFGFRNLEDVEIHDLKIKGKELSMDDYKEVYGKPKKERKSLGETKSDKDVTLNINNLSIINNDINLEYSIGDITENLEGELFESRRGEDNIVAEFTGESEYEVLYFEIAKGEELANSLYNKKVNNKPHLKMYLRDSENRILLFEELLPTKLDGLEISNTEECSVENDYLWYADVVDGTVEEIPVAEGVEANTIIFDEELIMKAVREAAGLDSVEIIESGSSELNASNIGGAEGKQLGASYTNQWGGSTIYKKTVSNGVEETSYRFYPYGYITKSSVPTSGNASWTASLLVSESTTSGFIDSPYTTTAYGINYFSLRNAEIAMSAGNHTQMRKCMVDGHVRQVSNGKILKTGSEIACKLLTYCPGTALAGKISSEIIGFIDKATTVKAETVKLGSDGVTIYDKVTTVAKAKLDSKYYMGRNSYGSEDGDSFKAEVTLSRTSESASNTTGAIQIKYDVYTNLYDAYLTNVKGNLTTFTYGNTVCK